MHPFYSTLSSPSTAGFIVPESVLPIAATSEHTFSINDMESDILSDKNDSMKDQLLASFNTHHEQI